MTALLVLDPVSVPSDLFRTEPTAPRGDEFHVQELQAHLRLRGYMNSVLDNLYTLNRAYCRPEEVAEVLTDIGRRLDLWYWTLPLEMRFSRHPSAFFLGSHRTSDLMVSGRE